MRDAISIENGCVSPPRTPEGKGEVGLPVSSNLAPPTTITVDASNGSDSFASSLSRGGRREEESFFFGGKERAAMTQLWRSDLEKRRLNMHIDNSKTSR